MQKHILVISQLFYPEEFRINDISAEWVKRGYKVTVITGIPNYPQGRFYKGYGYFSKRNEIYKGVSIIRIPILPRFHGSVMLALNYFSFVLSGFFWQIFSKLVVDYVFIFEVSPMTQALPGVWFAKRKKIPCYIYVTDLWPENVQIITGIENKLVINSIGRMVDYIYKRCNRIFTSSASFVTAIESRGINREKIEFWPQYAESFYRPVLPSSIHKSQIPQDGKCNIIFAGNIGYAQGLSVLVGAATIFKKRELHNIRFNIIGDGRYKVEFLKLISNNHVEEYFNFIGRYPATQIPEFFALCDASLICLSKNRVFEITLPAKTQSCFACGLPILVSADGEIQKVVNDARAGFCSNAGDATGLAENIVKFCELSEAERLTMSNNALAYADKNYNKETLLSRMDRWLSE